MHFTPTYNPMCALQSPERMHFRPSVYQVRALQIIHLTRCVHFRSLVSLMYALQTFGFPDVCTSVLQSRSLVSQLCALQISFSQMCALQTFRLPDACTSDARLSDVCTSDDQTPGCMHFRPSDHQMCALQMIRRPNVCTSDRLTTRCVHFRPSVAPMCALQTF